MNQEDADYLLNMAKFYDGSDSYNYPSLGGKINIPLTGEDKKERFMLDIRRGKISIKGDFKYNKNNIQHRVRTSVVLVRLDFGGSAPHRNPDGEEIEPNHIHIYKSGYADKFAYPIDPQQFGNLSNTQVTIDAFMHYCNIVTQPAIQYGVFS